MCVGQAISVTLWLQNSALQKQGLYGIEVFGDACFALQHKRRATAFWETVRQVALPDGSYEGLRAADYDGEVAYVRACFCRAGRRRRRRVYALVHFLGEQHMTRGDGQVQGEGKRYHLYERQIHVDDEIRGLRDHRGKKRGSDDRCRHRVRVA
ncbi:hypothetical protein [Mesorhizobium sp. M0047]|uniref:hypothetical protein n=1 Tax=Mesorhizobium sp. M0047 TaxID=2956859 RepID=UPI00333C9FD4